MEAASAAWPNFTTFLNKFRNHPALGLGAVDDAATPYNSSRQSVTEEEQSFREEDDDDLDRLDSCPSLASTHTCTHMTATVMA